MIWRRKCLKFGWYLPYEPSDLENGAWKKHYVMCIQTINIELPTKSAALLRHNQASLLRELDEKRASRNVEKAYRKWKKAVPLIHEDEPLRPPWVANNFRPKELEFSDKTLFGKAGKNKSLVAESLIAKKSLSLSPRSTNKHTRSKTSPGQGVFNLQEPGLQSLRRSRSEDFSFPFEQGSNPSKMTLSEAIKCEIIHQTDGMEQGDIEEHDGFQESFSPRRFDSSKMYTMCESMKSLQEFSMAYPNTANPRVVFISSKIPASELLIDAMLYGVLPIMYHHEGMTLCGLLEHFIGVLQGRKARSVGFYVTGESGSINLVRGSSVSLSSLEKSEMQKFWQALCMGVLSNDEGGHIDVFYPLGGTDTGMELLAQLQVLTGLTFSSPIRTVSSILNVDDDWLPVPEDVPPSKMYFNETKLIAWARAAEYVEETMSEVRDDVYCHFEDEKHALATKVIGQIMFQAFGLLEMSEIQDVSKVLVKALVLMTEQKHTDKVNPTTSFINCLQQCQKDRRLKKKRAKKIAPDEKELPSEVKQSNEKEVDSDESDESLESDDQSMNINLTERLSLGERRSVIAHEILSSERDYCNMLAIVQDAFRKPLEASIQSNRPVIGASNIRMIFNDSETLLTLSKELTNDLSLRLQDWDSHQCLGDVFLKFNTKLKAYINFLNNYPITLATIEKCRKQHPAFRGFLLQMEKQPSTKLMSLQNILLTPGKRIEEYVCLLEALLHHTPVEHQDHKNLKKAIEQIKQVKLLFNEAMTRLLRERRLKEVQKGIDNCPALAERGRFFIKQEDVVHLRQPDASDVKPEFRVFQNIGYIGLFLFNDCLVVTTKNLTSMPFQRTLEASYHYHSSLPLTTVKSEDITDSKYVQHVFTIVTSKRQWICQAKSKEAKVNWLSLLHNSKRTTLNRS